MSLPASMTLATLKTHPIAVLLVDDQPIIAEGIRRMLEDEKDITFHYCQDPTQALKMAEELHPTVILQDLVMPEIDGLTLIRYYRANPGTFNIPLIMLSTKDEPHVKAEAFALGVNDYLVKLPDKIELVARIRYHSKAYIRLLERNEAYEKLNEGQRILFSELAEAAEYVKTLLPPKLDGEYVKADWEFIPSTQLGGDAFSYHWLDADNFAVYLLDVCGHGVGAALLSISVVNVLRAQTLPNVNFYDPSNVLSALNEVFPMENHNNMFFTMWYGVYNKSRHSLTYSSGGHPPAILLKGSSLDAMKKFQLKTPGLVIGGMAMSEYVSETIALEEYNKLYVFSDGVFEMGDYSLEKFIDLIVEAAKASHDEDIEMIVKQSEATAGERPFPDDYSILRLILK